MRGRETATAKTSLRMGISGWSEEWGGDDEIAPSAPADASAESGTEVDDEDGMSAAFGSLLGLDPSDLTLGIGDEEERSGSGATDAEEEDMFYDEEEEEALYQDFFAELTEAITEGDRSANNDC